MFDRYTEKARRVIFFARYEAGRGSTGTIDPEHLLLGLIRENTALLQSLLPSVKAVDTLKQRLEKPATEALPTTVDMPLSRLAKRALAFAAEEAEKLGHRHIGRGHLLLGLLRVTESEASQLLLEQGLQIEVLRTRVAQQGVSVGNREMLHRLVESLPEESLQPAREALERLLKG